MNDLELALAAYWYLSNGYSDNEARARIQGRFPKASPTSVGEAIGGGRALIKSGGDVSGGMGSGKTFADYDLPNYGSGGSGGGQSVEWKLSYRWGNADIDEWTTIGGSFPGSSTLDELKNVAERDNRLANEQAHQQGGLERRSIRTASDIEMKEIVIRYVYTR